LKLEKILPLTPPHSNARFFVAAQAERMRGAATDERLIDISNGLEPCPVLVAEGVMTSCPASFPSGFQYVKSNVDPFDSASLFHATSRLCTPARMTTSAGAHANKRRREGGGETRGCDCPPGRSCDPTTCKCCRNADGFPIYRNRLLQRGICNTEEEACEDGTLGAGGAGGGFFLECGPACGCGTECVNRQSQRGVEVQLSLRVTGGGGGEGRGDPSASTSGAAGAAGGAGAGVGVFTDAALEEGTLVCSYSGEALSAEEAAARFLRNDAAGASNYILVTRQHSRVAGQEEAATEKPAADQEGAATADEGGTAEGGSGGGGGDKEGAATADEGGTAEGGSGGGGGDTAVRVRAIDPTRRGNVGRWLNHACDGGNLAPWMVRAAGDDGDGGGGGCRVVFFTTRRVEAGEELRWKYGESSGGESPPEPEGEREGAGEGHFSSGSGGRGAEEGGGRGAEEEEGRGEGEGEGERGNVNAVERREGIEGAGVEGGTRRRCTCATDACRGWMPFDTAALE
jgi:hypothetical protein